jgi:hypothetical protein
MKVAITECGKRQRVFRRTTNNRGAVSLAGQKFYGRLDGKNFVPDHRHKFAETLKSMKY